MILITGAPRSGTTYTGGYLRALGADVDIERVSNTRAAKPDVLVSYMWHRYHHVADTVLRIVRSPLDCIASMTTISDTSFDMMEQVVIVGYGDKDVVNRCAALWVAWQRGLTMACGRIPVYRVEHDMQQLAADIGLSEVVNESAVAAERNSRANKYGTILLNDIEADTRGDVIELAREYGYSI